MMGSTPRHRASGLTFVEMLLVLSLMGILAGIAVPYIHHRYRLQQELELRRALQMMRGAIDQYHKYAVSGQIEPPDVVWNGFPKDLQELVDGVDVKSPSGPSGPGESGVGQSQIGEKVVKVHFLRTIPVDPITGERDWDCRGYEDDAEERSSSCDDLFDVFSRSDRQALDGTYYKDW